MAQRIIFITGTDTGAGKTVFAANLTQRLRARGVAAVGLKPICSGGREDAVALWEASGKILALDDINPWHYRAALAPPLAASEEKKRIPLAPVLAHIRAAQQKFATVVVEGAGGLLSPLGHHFDSRDVIHALNAVPIIVCPNRLGAVNQLRLVWEALPKATHRHAQCVLVTPAQKSSATRTNRLLLKQYIPAAQLHDFPWIKSGNGQLARKGLDSLIDELPVARRV